MNKVHARDALVGAWRLVSWENQAADGQVTYPMGPDPNGYVLYAADGRFFNYHLAAGPGGLRRRRPAQRDRRGAGPGDGGLCRLRGPLQLRWRPRHPPCGAVVVPSWVGSDQQRWVELAGDRLTLRASPLLLAGKPQVPRLVWERVAPPPQPD